MSNLTPEEQAHYARQLALPGFGAQAQHRLKNSRVLVVGAGGLGAPVLLYLAAAGVGHIGIVDHDMVDASNLHRQVLYATSDVGQPKAAVAAVRLQQLNPHVEVTPYVERLTSENALDLISKYDLVADGTDNFPTRYLVNDACVLLGKVNVFASIFRFDGQVSVFNWNGGPNYRDLFPAPPPPDQVPDCAEGGVLGVLPGLIGSLQATEIIKVLAQVGEPLSGKLMTYNALTNQSVTLTIQPDPANPLTGTNRTQTGLIDYEQFCRGDANYTLISAAELASWRSNGKAHQLVDVRQPEEHAGANMGGTLIPLETLENALDQLTKNQPLVLHCKSGVRSAKAADLLASKHGFNNVFTLVGGIDAWNTLI